MSLRKGQPVKFSKPVSTMRTVLIAIEQCNYYKHDIIKETGLKNGQVQSALYNLSYIGMVDRITDDFGRSMYVAKGRMLGIAPCLRGINSIFNVPFTTSDN